MRGPMLRGADAAVERIERLCEAGKPTQELVEDLTAVVVAVTGAEGFFSGATDPETGLVMGAGVVEGMSQELCRPYWDHEFFVPDFNKFEELDERRPVADLHEATGGRPQRSARWRAFRQISDLDAELRMVLPAGGRTWGLMQLNRHTGSPVFGREERLFLERVAPIIGRGLRASLLSTPAAQSVGLGPGIVVMDVDGRVISMTPEAEAWLELVRGSWSSIDSGFPVPFEVFALSLAAARAEIDPELAPLPPEARRARLRTHDGTFLMLHASALRGTDHVAVVIEPAKASEVAPIIVEAYGLTPREVEVTKLVARGLKNDAIGAALFLSPHTVRDHLKAVFEKVGVSSRGELTSKLFAEHYSPPIATMVETRGDHVRAMADAL